MHVEEKNASLLTMSPENGVLTITQSSRPIVPIKLRILVPNTCRLDISVLGKSHVFIPKMNAPLRVTTQDISQVTIGACLGLIATQSGFSKVQVNDITGDILVNQSAHSEFGMRNGTIATALMTIIDSGHTSVATPIESLKLTTKGSARVRLGSITKTFMWTGYANDKVFVQHLAGVAEVTANYDSKLTVESADLQTLLAAASSTGQIKISGSVKNAAFSAKGVSKIIVDKVTGKILRKNESNKGTVRILNQ